MWITITDSVGTNAAPRKGSSSAFCSSDVAIWARPPLRTGKRPLPGTPAPRSTSVCCSKRAASGPKRNAGTAERWRMAIRMQLSTLQRWWIGAAMARGSATGADLRRFPPCRSRPRHSRERRWSSPALPRSFRITRRPPPTKLAGSEPTFERALRTTASAPPIHLHVAAGKAPPKARHAASSRPAARSSHAARPRLGDLRRISFESRLRRWTVATTPRHTSSGGS